jgi:hypothetical protein
MPNAKQTRRYVQDFQTILLRRRLFEADVGTAPHSDMETV